MNPVIESHYHLPASMPTWLVIAIAATAVALWVATHVVKRRLPPAKWVRAVAFGVRLLIGCAAMLATAQVMLRYLVLATNWPIGFIAFAGALALEIVIAFYALERRTVPRHIGFSLAALRIAIIVLVVTMLTQPVWRWDFEKTIQRFVAVLMDTSASMHIVDAQLSPSEKLRMASALAAGRTDRPFALEATGEDIGKMRSDLAAQADWLASLGSVNTDARRRQLADRRFEVQTALLETDRKAADTVDALARPLGAGVRIDPAAAAAIEEVRQALTAQVRPLMKEAGSLLSQDNPVNLDRNRDRLLQAIRQAAAALGEAESKVAAANEGLDNALYGALPADQRAHVDAMAGMKRLALARQILARSARTNASGSAAPVGGMDLIEKLQKRYTVKMWTFAGEPAEVNLRTFADSMRTGGEPLGDASALPPEQQTTDLGAALDKAVAEMNGKQLSGILLLSDGRDTTTRGVEPLLARMTARQVPVTAIVFGGARPPMDAAILSVDAPETVAVHDKFLAGVELKLDGLKGKDVRVALTDQDKPVDTQTIHVPTDSFRTRIQLANEPATIGLHHFAVDVQKFEGEAMTSNNTFPLSVIVADDRMKLLVIEGRPSWEFRYIKNLFASRDRTVSLQYVLLEPDQIAGIPPLPRIEASASRPQDEVEATALPKDEAEWMKFDAILLGDVPRKFISDEQLKIIRRFVTERGGTLIVSSGPRSMPHDYADTPLADLLPVTFKTTDGLPEAKKAGDEPYVPSPEKSFRIALTAEGRESVIMRQKTTPLENQEVWDGLPDLYWRHPIVKAKEAATVLAYALPPGSPEFLRQPSPAAASAASSVASTPPPPPPARPGEAAAASPPPASGADIQRQRRDFEREHALITYHNMALGKVMFVGTDHTWRLRYRVGDTYHHRLWGQILRWAAADKLPVGTETVKIGTDHTRYPPHSTVRVQAMIVAKDYTPVISGDVAVNIYAGDVLKLRRKLEYAEGSAGRYSAELGEFTGGTYRVELDAPPARPILEADHVEKVATEFTVDPSTGAEQADLTADRAFLKRLTYRTGGLMVEPSQAERVLEALGPPTESQKESREFILWNSWYLLVAMLLLATVEWLLRKKAGLA
jgi:hypothetical protein